MSEKLVGRYFSTHGVVELGDCFIGIGVADAVATSDTDGGD